MKLAFCIFKYSPFGGLERNFLRICRACIAAGHKIDVYCLDWQGEVPAGIELRLLPAQGSNLARLQSFVAQLAQQLNPADYALVVGFNRMPGLDLYYCADACHWRNLQQSGRLWRRFFGRHRFFLQMEQAVFASPYPTQILYLSETEQRHYQACYGTPDNRFQYLPPGIEQQKIRAARDPVTRQALRTELGLSPDQRLLLMVGSDFARKGVARSIRALAALPPELRSRCRLAVIGKGQAWRLKLLARWLGVGAQVLWLGGREDVPRFLVGADLFLHPARIENTGNVIIEALIAGLPVLATDNCGYGFHVTRAQAGELITGLPFVQADLDQALARMLTSPERLLWRDRALAYADAADLSSRPQVALQIIEQQARLRQYRQIAQQ